MDLKYLLYEGVFDPYIIGFALTLTPIIFLIGAEIFVGAGVVVGATLLAALIITLSKRNKHGSR